MDFVLKKIISLFIMPFPIGMILLLIGLIYLYRNKSSKAKVFIALSVIWLSFISYSPLVDRVLHKYESVYPTLHTAPKNIKYIYVLGNGHHTNESHPITSQVNATSSVRLNEAIRLYRQLREKPIIIVSGYSGLFDPTPGALMQEKLALALGIKKENLHVEPKPRDTQEEAKAAKTYIGDAPFILVTSATHMKRAMKFFHYEGLNPIAAPTNHLANIKHPNFSDFFSVLALKKSTIIWHETLGLIWQKVKEI